MTLALSIKVCIITSIDKQQRENTMQLINNTYEHAKEGFQVKVTTCNKKVATTENVETGELVKFNRGKLEWMVNKGVFKQIETND